LTVSLSLLQWSPPPDDGSTGLPNVAYADGFEPQWSPALYRREHRHTPAGMLEISQLQWSPPSDGGKTRT
jgi:hypothetical protein